MTQELRLWAVRGATKVRSNDPEAIVNGPERIVSCIFTSTHDLNAEFPAVAARNVGLDSIPLLCAQEIDVPGAMPAVIRALVHYYAGQDHRPAHTYLGEAQDLRSDLKAAQ
jgi:chorismate mutase